MRESDQGGRVRQRRDAQRPAASRRGARVDDATGAGQTMRACRACHIEKSLNEFHGDGRGGLFARCKTCVNAAQRSAYHADLDRKRALGRRQTARARAERPEQFSADARRATRQREYRKHRQRIVERARQWRRDHPGASWRIVKAWRVKNPERYAHGHAAVQARRRDRSGAARLKPREIREMLDAQWWICAYCPASLREVPYHLEHRTPLSRGGRTVRENLCMACASCNRRKQCQTAEEFQAA